MDAVPIAPATLRLRWPIGVSCGVALLLVLGVAGAGEIVARTGCLETGSLPPVSAAGQAQLDKKFNLLLDMKTSGREVDVIFLGNSQVHRESIPITLRRLFSRNPAPRRGVSTSASEEPRR